MRKFLLKILGWSVKGSFPDVDRSVIVAAPHTSYWDGFYGFLALGVLKIPFFILADTTLFHFPMTILMKIIHAVPVNVKGKDAIHDSVRHLRSEKKMHMVICPEGQLAPTDKWNPGFYHIARLAEVPVIVCSLDYRKKEVAVKRMISDLSDQLQVFEALKEEYSGTVAAYPEKFLLPEANLRKLRGKQADAMCQ